jgi:hypothetical protein
MPPVDLKKRIKDCLFKIDHPEYLRRLRWRCCLPPIFWMMPAQFAMSAAAVSGKPDASGLPICLADRIRQQMPFDGQIHPIVLDDRIGRFARPSLACECSQSEVPGQVAHEQRYAPEIRLSF